MLLVQDIFGESISNMISAGDIPWSLRATELHVCEILHKRLFTIKRKLHSQPTSRRGWDFPPKTDNTSEDIYLDNYSTIMDAELLQLTDWLWLYSHNQLCELQSNGNGTGSTLLFLEPKKGSEILWNWQGRYVSILNRNCIKWIISLSMPGTNCRI